MKGLTERDIRDSFVNCTRGETRRLAIPPTLETLDWQALAFLGWVDPKAPNRAYLVAEREDSVVGIALRRPDRRPGIGVRQQCSLCLTNHMGDGVSLMVAPLAGAAGRQGNTVGTYLCRDLGCADFLTGRRPPPLKQPVNETLTVAERVERAHARLQAFLDSVLQHEPTTLAGG